MTDEERFVHQHIEEFRYLRQTEDLIDEGAASLEARKSVPWRLCCRHCIHPAAA
ncbi:MAG: hypothetical protein ACJ73N_17625 [Bryobacteraceae bacterium]